MICKKYSKLKLIIIICSISAYASAIIPPSQAYDWKKDAVLHQRLQVGSVVSLPFTYVALLKSLPKGPRVVIPLLTTVTGQVLLGMVAPRLKTWFN